MIKEHMFEYKNERKMIIMQIKIHSQSLSGKITKVRRSCSVINNVFEERKLKIIPFFVKYASFTNPK